MDPVVQEPKRKIVIVEDDSFLSSLLRTRFQRENFDVTLVDDGEKALQIIQEQSPDLILLDIILPKKSGFEFMESIQSDPQLRQIPIIIISNLGQDSDMGRGRELGAVDYFVKAQVSIDDLVKKAIEHLNKATPGYQQPAASQ